MIQRDIATELIEAATPDFLKGIGRLRKIVGDRCSKGYVLYKGHEQYTLKGIRVFNPLAHEGLVAGQI
jgi:hypothetical protein